MAVHEFRGPVAMPDPNPNDDRQPTTLGSVVSLLQTFQPPLDADLVTIASLNPPDGAILRRVAGAWSASTIAEVKAALALAKADVGLSNVDNTADVDKPISTAVQGALNGKVNTNDSRLTDARTPTAHTHGVADLSATGTRSASTYLRGDGAWATPSTGATVSDATTSAKGIVALAGDLGGTAAAPTVPGLAGKAPTVHTHDYAPTGHTHAAPDLSGYQPWNPAPRGPLTISANSNVDVGAAGDLQLMVTGGAPVLTPTNGQNGRVCVVECYASGGARTVSVAATVVLTTGITSRSLAIPSGQRGIFVIRYTTLGTPEYSLVSAYLAA